MDLIVAFITGLTTGGLGCLAVQGGLLTSTLAHQIEQDMLVYHGTGSTQKFKPHIVQPILFFLLAKLIAHTILGYLLGAVGSVLQLTPLIRAFLYFAIGIFMLGNGLRMFNVHPIFRYFVIEPPSSLTRYIRRKSKNGASFFTPILLGTLTIFLPCGVTQAMMATALGTGSPFQGATLMFSYILGTSPLFFSVAYFATKLGSVAEKYFTRIVAVMMLIMGLVQVDTGLNLSGASFSFSRTVSILQAYALPAQTGLSVEVTENGYFPQILHLSANQPLTIEWVTRNTKSCARSVVVSDLDYQQILPVTGRTQFEIPPQEKGAIIRYTCSMGMYPSQLVFDLDPTETNQ